MSDQIVNGRRCKRIGETNMKAFRTLALFCALGLAAACNEAPQQTSPIADEDVMTPTNSSRDIGEYSVHVNALPTDELTAEIASLYGIARSQNRAMLNVSVLRKNPGGSLIPSRATVSASATNLTGQVRNLTMREITEGEGIYYIGETVITNAETLVFTIEVTPEGSTQPHTLRYMRQFFVD
jgi:Domain of unknown function (DUF4426)